MKLYYSATSPYARKVRVVALEKGLDERLELVLANPWPDPTAIVGFNPLGKVPVLVTDDGLPLYDSPVISEYLDDIGTGAALIPASGSARWRVLRTQALADGLLDAAVVIVLDGRRPAAERSVTATERAAEAIRRAVAALAAERPQAAAAFDLGAIATAVALGYLDFRLPELGVGASHRALHEWWHAVRERPSLAATRPP